ncbi:hypothetical protein U9R90_15240 [Streptomyces sp. E11-3]|uniref:hypothetical protein n=1 Tax=Streptomyces sp. E11-3 TaxID=3110112 RepID=UPI00397EF704
MGWTHDFSDAARNRRSATAANHPHPGSGPQGHPGGPHDQGHDPRVLGIPRILRRRARWVSARLRHTRA